MALDTDSAAALIRQDTKPSEGRSKQSKRNREPFRRAITSANPHGLATTPSSLPTSSNISRVLPEYL